MSDPPCSEMMLALLEAYALALAGRRTEALCWLDGRSAAVEAAGASDAIRDEYRLARARILRTRGDPASVESGNVLLGAVASGTTSAGCRAGLDLSWQARCEGRMAGAAAFLHGALETARSLAGAGGPVLELRVRSEVLALESQAHRTSPEPARSGTATPQAHTLVRLVDLGRQLALETEPRGVLQRVLREAIELARVDRGFVALFRGDALEFLLAERRDLTTITEPLRQVSRTLIRLVRQSGGPIYAGLGRAVPDEAARTLSMLGVNFAACVPLGAAGSTAGLLYLDSERPPGLPEGEFVQLLDLFSALAAAALENAWRHQLRDRELETAREMLRRQRDVERRRAFYGQLVGASDAMQIVFRQLDRVLASHHTALVLGETGTGKDLVARLLHERGPRRNGPFVVVHCGGVPDGLLEDELFGHDRGAFSGADTARPGVFELAHEGTLFLDEIGDTSPRMQAALLRALESGEVHRLGGREPHRFDVRVVAATHRDLEAAVRDGAFRGDLFFRLDVLRIQLPPLRERPEDIPLLLSELARRDREGAPNVRFDEAAMTRLFAYGWPGNVRELANLVRRLRAQRIEIAGIDHLPPEIATPGATPARTGTLREIEQEAVRRALEAAAGNVTAAARALGIDRKTLRARLR